MIGLQRFGRALKYSTHRVPLAARHASSSAVKPSKASHMKGEVIPEDIAQNAALVQTLRSRLGLTDIPSSAIARSLMCPQKGLKYKSNAGMSDFGTKLLKLVLAEYYITKFPRLPASVLSIIEDLYLSPKPLAQVAELWGIQTDTRDALARYLQDLPMESIFGRLTYEERVVSVEKGIKKVTPTEYGLTRAEAMAKFVSALISAIYSERGLNGVRAFVTSSLIKPRIFDISTALTFAHPVRELAALCEREGLAAPETRLMAETGRLSASPTFIMGVFSGDQQLGEGHGTSLKEAKIRAHVNALQSWYLYSPIESEKGLPQDADASAAPKPSLYIDPGQVIV